MDELVTIRTFNSSIDFEMAKSYLGSCGIECFGQDEIINRAYIANVNGGVKLQVRAVNAEEALQLLLNIGYLQPEDFEPSAELKWIDKILAKFRNR